MRGIATELSPTSGNRLVCYCDDRQAFARFLVGWWIAGKGTPSPFFDEKANEPRALPHVLSAVEREALKLGTP